MSRLDKREPVWWGRLDEFSAHAQLSELQRDELFEMICDAIHAEGAIEAASRGGLKGGVALARKLTKAQRSASASHAATARWRK